MAKADNTWGLNTPSRQTQQWLDDAKRLIESKEIDWGKELVGISRLKKQADEILDQEMRKPEGQRFAMPYAYDVSRDWYIALLVIRLGLDVVTLSKQVTDMHKVIKDMKLAIKC